MKILNFFKLHKWGIVRVYRDIVNYRDWIKTIKKEAINRRSKFNQYELKYTSFYDVYLLVSLEEADTELIDSVKKLKVVDLIAPVNKYLDEELLFAENLAIEFNQFIDDEGKPTLTYLIVYRFIFSKLSVFWLLRWATIILMLYFFLNKINFLNLLHV